MAIRLEVHLEWPWHAVSLPEMWIPSYSSNWTHWWDTVFRLTLQLNRHHVPVTFYTIGEIAKESPNNLQMLLDQGHHLGSHGYFHRHHEREGDTSDFMTRQYLPECVGYRSPFWDTTPRPGMAGGVFFRTLPYQMLKREVEQQRVLYLHPHDLEPSDGGPIRRQLFFCDPWQRLERLLTEVDFERR